MTSLLYLFVVVGEQINNFTKCIKRVLLSRTGEVIVKIYPGTYRSHCNYLEH